MRRIAIGALLLLAAGTARALEVSLEENKAQRGNIGYVDVQKIFRLYPETQKAKQNFEEVLRQAEEQVNLRKAELIGLRAEIVKLRMERDAASKLAAGLQVPPEPPPAPAAQDAGASRAVLDNLLTASTDTSSGAQLAVALSSGAVAEPSASTATVTTATAAATAPAPDPEEDGAPLIINLPGLSPEPIVVRPPGGQQASASVTELELKLAERSKILQDKESEFKTYQAQVEKNLLELEDKRTEILLGKIYHVVQEVAREEGVSVVVDKSQILFGHKAMDLTEKVLKKLKST